MSKRKMEKKNVKRIVKMTKKPDVIKFFAPVVDITTNALMNAIDSKMKQGTSDFIILVSCTGGTVYHGLSAYNYLKGIPAKITTHNFGVADSMGLVLYCGGSKRLSVPQARFLLHGVAANFTKVSLEEPQLEERLKSLRSDTRNIAEVMAVNTNKNFEEIKDAMLERTTLTAEEAKSWGLVHEIKSKLFEEGSEVINILAAKQPQPQL